VTVFREYIEILTDPAHALAELTFVALDAALLTPIVLWLRRLIRREHAAIDTEHGVTHRDAVPGVLREDWTEIHLRTDADTNR
jgi:hypothetical protein